MAIVLAGGTAEAAAPQQLYGKSVVVTWTENRAQQAGGAPGLRHVGISGEFSAYVSSAGRLFNRLTYRGPGPIKGMPGRVTSASSDELGGRTTGSASRSVSFQGRTLVMTMPLESGARRMVITFDGDFSSCSARMLTGKAGGAASIGARGLESGRPLQLAFGADRRSELPGTERQCVWKLGASASLAHRPHRRGDERSGQLHCFRQVRGPASDRLSFVLNGAKPHRQHPAAALSFPPIDKKRHWHGLCARHDMRRPQAVREDADGKAEHQRQGARR